MSKDKLQKLYNQSFICMADIEPLTNEERLELNKHGNPYVLDYSLYLDVESEGAYLDAILDEDGKIK